MNGPVIKFEVSLQVQDALTAFQVRVLRDRIRLALKCTGNGQSYELGDWPDFLVPGEVTVGVREILSGGSLRGRGRGSHEPYEAWQSASAAGLEGVSGGTGAA